MKDAISVLLQCNYICRPTISVLLKHLEFFITGWEFKVFHSSSLLHLSYLTQIVRNIQVRMHGMSHAIGMG
jgi:hypothetical protein